MKQPGIVSGIERSISPPPVIGHAQLTNMALAYQAMADCEAASENMPRLGVFYGPSGFGKSVGAAFAAARFGTCGSFSICFTSPKNRL